MFYEDLKTRKKKNKKEQQFTLDSFYEHLRKKPRIRNNNGHVLKECPPPKNGAGMCSEGSG